METKKNQRRQIRNSPISDKYFTHSFSYTIFHSIRDGRAWGILFFFCPCHVGYCKKKILLHTDKTRQHIDNYTYTHIQTSNIHAQTTTQTYTHAQENFIIEPLKKVDPHSCWKASHGPASDIQLFFPRKNHPNKARQLLAAASHAPVFPAVILPEWRPLGPAGPPAAPPP